MSFKSAGAKALVGGIVFIEMYPEIPKIEVEYVLEQKTPLMGLVHIHQHFEMNFEVATAMAITSTGVVSAGSPFGFTPRFSPHDLTPPRPVVPLGVGGYLEKLRF